MKIVVTGGKGGVGKSMVATSLSIMMASSSKTMLIDADVECPNDHLLLNTKRKFHSNVYQPIPSWDFSKCIKCGKCASICKQEAIAFVESRYPAFIKEACIGCKACMAVCPTGAIKESKKDIGKIYTAKSRGVFLVSGETKLGELASGEIVASLRNKSDALNKKFMAKNIIIDSAPGIGCPVIASITGTDYMVAVTEPTPSALHDLERVLYLANHFSIRSGILINKFDIAKNFCKKIESYSAKKGIPIIGRIPYSKDFIKSSVKMKTIFDVNKKYNGVFKNIISEIE